MKLLCRVSRALARMFAKRRYDSVFNYNDGNQSWKEVIQNGNDVSGGT
jgi:hypothetical protein